MGFEQRLAHLVHRGAITEAGHAGPAAGTIADADAHREDPMDRAHPLTEMDVGGRITKGAAQLLAMLDMAVDHEGTAEEPRGVAEAAFGEQGTHLGRRDTLTVDQHRRNGMRGEAEFRAHRLQEGEVAAAPMAEAEILAHPHFAGSHAADDHLTNEVLGGHHRQGFVEAQRQQFADARGPHALGLLAHAGKTRHGFLREEGARQGSKVMTAGARPRASARRRTSKRIAWWPRCRPSKAPIATTLPSGARHGPSTSRWRRSVMPGSPGIDAE